MKRAEFIKLWIAKRERFIQAEVKAGRWRVSEAVMTVSDLPNEAKRLWRKHAKSYRTMSKEELGL